MAHASALPAETARPRSFDSNRREKSPGRPRGPATCTSRISVSRSHAVDPLAAHRASARSGTTFLRVGRDPRILSRTRSRRRYSVHRCSAGHPIYAGCAGWNTGTVGPAMVSVCKRRFGIHAGGIRSRREGGMNGKVARTSLAAAVIFGLAAASAVSADATGPYASGNLGLVSTGDTDSSPPAPSAAARSPTRRSPRKSASNTRPGSARAAPSATISARCAWKARWPGGASISRRSMSGTRPAACGRSTT